MLHSTIKEMFAFQQEISLYQSGYRALFASKEDRDNELFDQFFWVFCFLHVTLVLLFLSHLINKPSQ